jgi:hypothetical protein
MEVNMSQTFQPIFFGILIWISLTAFFVLIETLFPKIVREGKEIAEDSMGRAFWLGLINSIFLLALIFLFFYLANTIGVELISLPGIVFAVIFIIGGIAGLSAMFQLIGDRLFPDKSPFKKRSYAVGIAILACFAPYVGWLGLFPYLLLVGFGALVIRTYNRYRASKVKAKEKV